jgi:glucokinase
MGTALYPRLLGDIGGTNARLAWQADASAPGAEVASYACAAHGSLLSTVRLYLAERQAQRPKTCAFGIAKAILGDRVQMPNHHWSFSISQLQHDLGVERLAVVNDFTALALSPPALDQGAGLGLSGLLPTVGGRHVAITGIDRRYALADVAQAHRDLEARKTTGSSVLVP